MRAIKGSLGHSLEERYGELEWSRASHIHGRVHPPPMDAIPNAGNRISRRSLTENVFLFSSELSDCKVQGQAMIPAAQRKIS
jgi:hypothetical protein